MSEITYREAINRAMVDAMEEDERVFLLGEDVAAAGGVFKVTEGILDRFGPERVLDTPISEQAIIGCALGAAISGLRPVAELMFADFSAVCYDQLINEIPKYRYMTGGQVSVPMVVRLANGGGIGFGAQHSQAAENWYLNFPGLKVMTPGTPSDAYHMLRAAIEDPDPVLYFEHKNLLGMKGEVDFGATVDVNAADIVREGDDVTVVATQMVRGEAEEAARKLGEDGISVEILDPRILEPFDLETVVESVGRTGRLVCVQEANFGGSWGATLVARFVEAAFDTLDAAPLVIGGDDSPIPYAGNLEAHWIPSAERIAAGIRNVVES